MEKRLYRSRSDRMIWGVCGGLADYLNVDVTVIRLVMVLLVFANGISILAYIIMTIIVPQEDSKAGEVRETMRENVGEMKDTAGEFINRIDSAFGDKEAEIKDRSEKPGKQQHWVSIVLIVVGLFFLAANLNFFWWFHWGKLWPLTLVAVGLLLIVTTWRKRYE